MNKKPKITLLLAALLLLVLFFVPLWRITLQAPQYPDGISMYIWINQITGDTEYTLQNINILNHYVGMKYIEPDSIPELGYFPKVVAAMVLLGVFAAFSTSKYLRITWVLVLLVLYILGIYDFYLWEYDYGHNLSDTAPIKVPGMAYQPPLFGSKMLLNFEASSYPHWGGGAMIISLLLGMLSIWLERKIKPVARMTPVTVAAMLVGLLSACSMEPQPINYGQEGCHDCKMTMVDTRYGTELVTTKGKVHKFDAVECLVNYLQSEHEINTHSTWVTSFDNPEKLVEASNCRFLLSAGLPSPMGMNLTAFDSHETALEYQQKYGGELYDWQELQAQYSDLALGK